MIETAYVEEYPTEEESEIRMIHITSEDLQLDVKFKKSFHCSSSFHFTRKSPSAAGSKKAHGKRTCSSYVLSIQNRETYEIERRCSKSTTNVSSTARKPNGNLRRFNIQRKLHEIERRRSKATTHVSSVILNYGLTQQGDKIDFSFLATEATKNPELY